MEKKIPLEVKLSVTVHATQEKFEGPDRTFVLLHGYGETKERIKRKLLETVQPSGVPLHIIHGNSDSQSDLNFAKEEFGKLQARNTNGSSIEVEGGHNIDPVKLDAVRSILERLDQGVRP